MGKFSIFVCESFFYEVKKIVETERLDDVIVKPYGCLCNSNNKTIDIKKILDENSDSGLVLVNSNAKVILPEKSNFNVLSRNYCISHILPDETVSSIIKKGGYVVDLGFLNKWQERLTLMNLNTKEEAKKYFQSKCSKLVFFDFGVLESGKAKLAEFSNYLDLPNIVIPLKMEFFKFTIKSAVYEWRYQEKTKELSDTINRFQNQAGEFSSIINIISKLALYTNRREAFDKMKELFVKLFGAQFFRYHNYESQDPMEPVEIKKLYQSKTATHIFLNEAKKLFIKVEYRSKIYGVLEISEFMFPNNINKYFVFAIEIVKIYASVLANIDQYEKLVKFENDLQYLNYHDSTTGLYNWAYVQNMLLGKPATDRLAIFSIDIDRLRYINEKYGAKEGDKLIVSTAEILKKSFRESDILARIGGDEFIVILLNCDDQTAEMLNNRIDEAVQGINRTIENEKLRLSISIGYSVSKSDDETFDTIMQKADEFMALKKQIKKNIAA